MSSTNLFQRTIQILKDAPQQIIHYISAGVSRIFGLNDDNYPETGGQPFEGELPDERERF